MAINISSQDTIQMGLDRIVTKTARCDVTVGDDIALVSAALAVANYTGSISDEDSRAFSSKFREYIDLFPNRCKCNLFK